ncbi:MAG TPA: DeoR/GlpR family DNA-binding transcription regulator [Hyphomonadaceae bacterium]|jgi:DeoR family ulaG and ulaABCDEF operon transcriptional repressor|nr:DeoR/GlpR family DNA-binding transcription regulator [Hyphomonadaceae bacterium]
MHSAEREEMILKLVRANGFISFKDLDQRLRVSPATVRRDLGRMEDGGLLVRVHGGAKAVNTAAPEDVGHLSGVPFHVNIARNPQAKAAIGKAAAQLCREGEAVIIDGGSTTLQMCPHLEQLGLQVLTNSLHIVSALLPQPRTRISLPAGTVFREQNIVLSPLDDDGSGQFHASKMFLGAAAVGPFGLLQADVLLLQAESRLMERADELILLADSSKFEAPTGHLLCPLGDIDTVVTDRRISSQTRRMFRDAGVKVIVAD